MLKKPLDYFADYDEHYPGFIQSVVNHENMILPTCPFCGSYHTALVAAGIVSRSIHLMAATTRFRINPQFPGRLYCNDCERYFTPEDFEGPIWWKDLITVDEDEAQE